MVCPTHCCAPLVAACALIANLSACSTTPNYKIERTAPLIAEVGEHYGHFLDPDTYHDSNGFESCREDSPLTVEDSGYISFTPETPGEIRFCVALTYEGKRIDKYEFVVEVSELAEEKRNAREKSKTLAEDFAPKLAAMREATSKIESPKAEACQRELADSSSNDRELVVFPEKVPNWNVGAIQEIELAEEILALAPAQVVLEREANTNTELEELSKIVQHSHAVLYRLDELERPKVEGKFYAGGFARGWLFVVDIKSAGIVCQTPFRYQPPPSVLVTSALPMAAGEKIPAGYSEIVIIRQLHQNGRAAFSTRLAELSPGWTLPDIKEAK